MNYHNKETGEIVKVEKDSLFCSTSGRWEDGYWVYTKRRTDFLALEYFNQKYELTNQ